MPPTDIEFTIEVDRDILAKDNMPLVFHVVNKYKNRVNIDFEELYSIALLGYARAVTRYDPNKGVQFSTFACVCMQRQILQELRNANTQKAKATVLSYDAFKTKDIPDGDSHVLFMRSKNDPENEVIEKEVLCEAIKELENREKEMLFLRINGTNQTEIAQRYGISQSYVSRIITKARNKMVKYFQEVH